MKSDKGKLAGGLRPKLGEVCAIPLPGTYKRAALLFDRIWVPFSESKIENIGHIKDMVFNSVDPVHFFKSLEPHSKLQTKLEAGQLKPHEEIELAKIFSRACADGLQEHGISAIPVYPSEVAFETDFPTGTSIAYQAALLNIPMASEDNTWQQIIELRNDKEAAWKCRSLRAWLTDGLNAQSIGEAVDVISKKVDNYEWVMRKHGLKTITGTLSSVLDSKSLIGISAAAGSAGLIGGPIWASIAGGLLISARVATWLADRMIDIEDVRRGSGSEVALICDARKMFVKEKSKI